MYVQRLLLFTELGCMYIQHVGTFCCMNRKRRNSMKDLLAAVAAGGNGTVFV